MRKESTRFKRFLKEKDMSLQEFALSAGLNSRSLEPYMSGAKDWRNARAWLLIAVADALGIDPRDLVNGAEESRGEIEKRS